MVAKRTKEFDVTIDFLIVEGEYAVLDKETVELINHIQKMVTGKSLFCLLRLIIIFRILKLKGHLQNNLKYESNIRYKRKPYSLFYGTR